MITTSLSLMEIARLRLGSLHENLALVKQIANRISWLALTLLTVPFALVNSLGNRVISKLELIFGEGTLWISRSLRRWQEDPSGEASIPKKFFALVLRSALLTPLLALDLMRATGNVLIAQIFPNPAWPPEQPSPAINFALQAIGRATTPQTIYRSLGGYGNRFPWDIYHCVAMLIVARLTEEPLQAPLFAEFLSDDNQIALDNLRRAPDKTMTLQAVRACPSPDAVQDMKGNVAFYAQKIYDLGKELRDQRGFIQLVFPGH